MCKTIPYELQAYFSASLLCFCVLRQKKKKKITFKKKFMNCENITFIPPIILNFFLSRFTGFRCTLCPEMLYTPMCALFWVISLICHAQLGYSWSESCQPLLWTSQMRTNSASFEWFLHSIVDMKGKAAY